MRHAISVLVLGVVLSFNAPAVTWHWSVSIDNPAPNPFYAHYNFWAIPDKPGTKQFCSSDTNIAQYLYVPYYNKTIGAGAEGSYPNTVSTSQYYPHDADENVTINWSLKGSWWQPNSNGQGCYLANIAFLFAWHIKKTYVDNPKPGITNNGEVLCQYQSTNCNPGTKATCLSGASALPFFLPSCPSKALAYWWVENGICELSVAIPFLGPGNCT